MSAMPRNPNPNLGFRGNPNGVQGQTLVDYGVYAPPLQRALARFGYHSETLGYAAPVDIKRYIDHGWPVVTWITYRLQPAAPRIGTASGSSFILVPHEHAVLVIGYDARTVIANDPWTKSQVRYPWPAFEHSWGLFGRIGLAVEPCPEPLPVQRIAVRGIDTSGLTWSWSKAVNATQYEVTVTVHAQKTRIVYHGVLTRHRYTLPKPTPGASYEIAVQSQSACGGVAVASREWFDVPAVLPTPERTPVATPTPKPTIAQTPTAVATPTSTATASSG